MKPTCANSANPIYRYKSIIYSLFLEITTTTRNLNYQIASSRQRDRTQTKSRENGPLDLCADRRLCSYLLICLPQPTYVTSFQAHNATHVLQLILTYVQISSSLNICCRRILLLNPDLSIGRPVTRYNNSTVKIYNVKQQFHKNYYNINPWKLWEETSQKQKHSCLSHADQNALSWAVSKPQYQYGNMTITIRNVGIPEWWMNQNIQDYNPDKKKPQLY